jgi:cholesterol transport system auxiliary component
MSPRCFAVIGLVLATGGCALTSKADPATIRFYSPEGVSQRARPRPEAAKESGPALRLGRVAAVQHLEDKIVFRSSEHEVGFYDEHRWTEEPAEYLERALSRELFEARGLSRVVSGQAPTLQIELVAFEEIRLPRHVARVRLILVLHDERQVGFQETLTFERPLRSGEKGALAQALSGAMADAVDAVASRVVARLEAEDANAAKERAAVSPAGRPDVSPASSGAHTP